LVSKPEASVQDVSKDGKDFACNSSGKLGDIRSNHKFVKYDKHVYFSNSTDESRSRVVAFIDVLSTSLREWDHKI
jgi:hypothetical protein